MLGLHYYSALVTLLQAIVLGTQFVTTRPLRWARGARLVAIFAAAVAPLLAWMALAPGFHETLTVVRATASTTPLTARAFFDDLWRELSFGSIRWLPPQSVWGYALLPLVGLGAVVARLSHATAATAWLVVLLALAPMLSATLAAADALARVYILYSVPFLFVLVAWGIVWLGQRMALGGRRRRWLSVLAVATLGLVHYDGPYVKSDYRTMAADLAARVDPAADIVVLEAPRQHLLAKYYFPADWTLTTVPQIDVPDFWPLTAPPVVPENEDDRIQAGWRITLPSGSSMPGKAKWIAANSWRSTLAAVAYTQDCHRWLDVRDCRYVSPHHVQPDVAAADRPALWRRTGDDRGGAQPLHAARGGRRPKASWYNSTGTPYRSPRPTSRHRSGCSTRPRPSSPRPTNCPSARCCHRPPGPRATTSPATSASISPRTWRRATIASNSASMTRRP